MIAVLLAYHLIRLTGPEGQEVELNADQIVSLREPRGETHFPKDVRCLIHTSDGKFIGVIESCKIVHELLAEPD